MSKITEVSLEESNKKPKGTLGLSKEELKKKIQKQKDKDAEIVKGVFRFYEMPGGTLAFTYKAHKGQETETYTLTDGQMHEIPLGVAKHLNNNGWYPQYEYIKDEKFQAGYGMSGGMRIARKVHRYGFSGLDFVDIEEQQADKRIVTVTGV